MEGDFPMRFGSTDVGGKIHVLSVLRCLDPAHEAHLFQSCPDNVVFSVSGLIEGYGEYYTFLNATMVRQYPQPALLVDDDTKILQHCQPSWATLCEVIELCSGFGGMAQGYASVGFSPVLAVDFNDKMTRLYQKQCEVATLNADVSQVESIAKIWHLAKGASTLVAGYACQPFSMLGDQKGELDCRAMSLRGVLAVAFYTRAQAIVLECVIPASKNSWVKSEIQKFVDATGFHLSQTELHLNDIWPSRRSRAWWILTAPWLGAIPLPQWPKLVNVQKVCQVIPRVLAWDPEDEAKLLLTVIERQAFGVDNNTHAKYLLNMDGCAPCALHSWGSQLLPCECGCRASGLSMKRLAEKGLYGLLVRSVSDAFFQECRHIHPNECLALQGFDPTIDFGNNPRLTLAAAGQMASPFQSLWIFSCLAERIAQFQKGKVEFGPTAQLQAYQSWMLMRCRRVWPSEIEPICDSKTLSLMQFWKEVENLSIHELMHPPRWPQLDDAQVTIASILDLLSRRNQEVTRMPGRNFGGVLAITDDDVDIEDDSTPWFESPPDTLCLPSPRNDACIVVFFHEFADPITLVAAPDCTIHDFVQAHEKLVGTLQITCISNQHGVEIHPSRALEPGMVLCIRCEDKPASSPETTAIFPCMPEDVSDSCRQDTPKMDICQPECKPDATLSAAGETYAHDSALFAAANDHADPKHAVSPTAPWTQPAGDVSNVTSHPFGLNDAPCHVFAVGQTTSWISAAPLLGLQNDQFLQLRVPAVVTAQHLESLHCQIMRVEDRVAIFQQQSDFWSDDELQFHMHVLAQSYIDHQKSHGVESPRPCFVIDPLLVTGWLHHGLHECGTWGSAHPEIKDHQQMVITACMLNHHWIPIVMCAQGLKLRVYTWDAPGNDHEKLNAMCDQLAKAIGFSEVTVDRHHRLFLSSDRCGALAISFLAFSLIQTMLPTTRDETEVIHRRLKKSFADELAKHRTTVRPWIWGAGDAELTLPSDVVGSHVNDVHGHTCISTDQRMDLLRFHGMKWGDDEMRFHITYMLNHDACILCNEDCDIPGFVFLDPLSLVDWELSGKNKFVQWCQANPHIRDPGHHIISALLVDDHWLPIWIEYRVGYFLVHLQHDEITRVEHFGHLLDVLCSQFGLTEYVLHWSPQLVSNHRICGAAAIAFLGQLLVRAALPRTEMELRTMQAHMRASFVQAVFLNECCRCPVAWGSGSPIPKVLQPTPALEWQLYEPVDLGSDVAHLSFGSPMEDRICRKIANVGVMSSTQQHTPFSDPWWCATEVLRNASPTQARHPLCVPMQWGAWTDTELRFHLHKVAEGAREGLWISVAPFVAEQMPEAVDAFLGFLTRSDQPPISGLVSAVLCDDHWIPLVVRFSGDYLQVETWDQCERHSPDFRAFGLNLAKRMGVTQNTLICQRRKFFSNDKCGALAIAFISHVVNHTVLPADCEELETLHCQLKLVFRSHLAQQAVDHSWDVMGWGDAEDGPEADLDPHGRSHECITSEQRLELLRVHDNAWGDDEIRFHLAQLLSHRNHAAHLRRCGIPGVVVLEPLILHTWSTLGPALCESWCRSHAQQIARGFHIVSALLVRDHWIPIWIVPNPYMLQVHLLHDDLLQDDDVLPLVTVMKTVLGFPEHVLHRMPQRITDHSLCGAVAVSFLNHILLGSNLPLDLQALTTAHANLRASFVQAVLQNQCCRCPIAWGAGPSPQLLKSLMEELAKHGVPESNLEMRAQQAIRAIGQEAVHTALQAKNVWRSLKAIGSNVKFQFILPDEMEKLVQANKGATVGKKVRAAKINEKVPVPEVLDPAKIALLDDAFRFAGNPVPQISAQQIGPVASGVAVLSMKDAAPYLKAGKPVSSAPLAIVVLADPACQLHTALPHVRLMVPCICVANQEPLLVEATLVQLGVGHVEKHIVAKAIALDSLEVVTVKIMTYRDEYTGCWDDFCSAPIKKLVQAFPVLRRCFETGCNCECWHNVDDLQVKEPILDVWRRQYLSSNFRPVAATKAAIYSVCLRIPMVILSCLLARSGQAGSYMEPRTPDGKQVLDDYVVVWAPKLTFSELAHMKQTNPAVIGLARLGDRRGLRVMQAQAQSIHAIVKPEATFLPNGPKSQYSAGPFPWGSDRAAITKALKQVGWHVQALQPMQPVPGKGSMWLIQSVDSPPETILNTNHGEVVITKHKAGHQPVKPAGNFTVGSVSTLSLCGPASSKNVQENDPWLQGDPWGPYNKTRQVPTATVASDGIQQLEERIQTAVLAKLPVNMEQDDLPQRLHTLEEQVHQLMGKNQSLESQFHEFSAQSNQQFAVVQTQIQQQTTQFHGQLESQSQSIQAMFEQQMNQIRGILSKRPRDDTME